MSLHLTIRDEQTGDVQIVRIPDGEYFILATDPCHLAHVHAHANGTHVLTVKDRSPRPLPDEVNPMSTDNQGNWRALADALTYAMVETGVAPDRDYVQDAAKAATEWMGRHGYRIVADDGRHYADIGPDGWSIQHPVECRDDMLSCWFHLAAQDQWYEGPPASTGRYWIDRGTKDDPDELVLVERVGGGS